MNKYVVVKYIHGKWSENIVIRFSKTRMACDVIGNETVHDYYRAGIGEYDFF